ncbi:MAG TPA: CAP domain-containing protein [Acidimicrobiia bacterium]|nr:CAP domain-containing protein [Acidimicrobiia bacterium]
MNIQRLMALALGILVFAGSTAVASASASEESEFVSLINQSRSAAGLAPLSVHNDLVFGARNHTAEMIPTGTIFHSTSAELSGVTTGWSVLGENVGKGPNPSVLHQAFMASPSHKANILGGFDRVGVGVGHDAEGRVYVTVMFMKSANAPAPTTTTTTTAPAPAPAPAPTTTTTTTAPAPAPTAPTPTVSQPDPAPEAAPSRPSAPAVDRVAPRTLGLELFDDRWIEGTYCVTIRLDGAICAE